MFVYRNISVRYLSYYKLKEILYRQHDRQGILSWHRCFNRVNGFVLILERNQLTQKISIWLWDKMLWKFCTYVHFNNILLVLKRSLNGYRSLSLSSFFIIKWKTRATIKIIQWFTIQSRILSETKKMEKNLRTQTVICVYVYMCMCIYTYVCVNIRTYIHTSKCSNFFPDNKANTIIYLS